MTKQWHPAFVQLLRPSLRGHYEIQTNVPVGDAPRLADIVLLRRTSVGPLPFCGLWGNLTPWNALEFKGPTSSPRSEDLDLLVEMGLGIYRRLNEEREQQGEAPLAPTEMSFWYLANHLGTRLLRGWREHVGLLEEHGPGVWRCTVLRRPVFLVSGIDLPVEEDSLPMHLIGKEPAEREREVGHFLVNHPKLWQEYGGWLAGLHRATYREVEAMAKTKGRKFGFDLGPLIETLGEDWVIDALGPGSFVKVLTSPKMRRQLTPEMRRTIIEKLGGVVPPTDHPPK